MTALDVEALLASISLVRVVGMALLGFGLGALVTAVYSTYLPERIPWYVPAIVGLGAIGLWMNTASAIVAFVESTETEGPLILQDMETNAAAILIGGVATMAGARAGERLAPSLRALTGATQLDVEVGRIVRTVGRFTTVTLPKLEDVEDIEDYEPVPEATKEKFAGVELVFARGLTVDELHRRITDRLRSDYGVGQVDLELDAEGKVEYLAVGSRAAGIGPTLPPRQVAMEITANPAPDASPGDRVQVWQPTGDGGERVATAELRATEGDAATLAIDASRADDIDQSATYRLVTMPATKQFGKEFAGLLRTANETMDTATVDPEGALRGVPVGALKPAVAAIKPSDAPVETLPPRDRLCEPGDTLYAVGRPDELRKLAAAATPPAPEPAVEPEEPADDAPAGLRERARRLLRLGR